MSYTLKVEIANEDLDLIRQVQYNLCLTKGVRYQGKDLMGNVVFTTVPSRDLAEVAEFSWVEKHQIYMTNTFQVGEPCIRETQTHDISQGMTANVDEHGIVKVTGNPDMTKPILVNNNWKDMGRVALATYKPTTEKFETNFISEPTPLASNNSLAPIELVGVFFHREHATDVMIDVTQTPSFPVHFTGQANVTIRYEDGKWCFL